MMRMVWFGLRGAVLGALTLAMAPLPAAAQMSNNPAEINACLCLERSVETMSQTMNNRTQALAAVRQHLADLNAELARQRPLVDVNNQESVDRYKALLDQRDAAYRQSIGPVVSDADRAVARYNALVQRYNGECANHPFNSAIMHEMQATLACPPQP
jgi:multidrug resistance efflux pump